MLVLKSAQKFVVLKISEEGRLMRHSEVLDDFQKMVRLLGVEIQSNPTAGAFHLD